MFFLWLRLCSQEFAWCPGIVRPLWPWPTPRTAVSPEMASIPSPILTFHSENLVPSHRAPSGSLSVPLLIPTSTQFLVAPMLLGNKRPLHSTSVTETQKSPNSPQCEGIQVPPPGHITQPFLLYSLVWRNKGLSPLPGLPGEVSLLSAV